MPNDLINEVQQTQRNHHQRPHQRVAASRIGVKRRRLSAHLHIRLHQQPTSRSTAPTHYAEGKTVQTTVLGSKQQQTTSPTPPTIVTRLQ